MSKYLHPLSHYEATYGKSSATIKRWSARGLPLDNPDAMGEYLSPRGRKSEEEDFESPSIVTPDDPDSLVETPVALDQTFFDGEGVLAEIVRLQKAGRERAGAYFAAVTSKRANSQVIQNRLKEWQSVVEALRKLEKDSPNIRKANGLSVDVAEAQAEIGQVFAALRMAIENRSGRAAAKLVGLKDRQEIAEVLAKEDATLIAILRNIAMGQPEGADE